MPSGKDGKDPFVAALGDCPALKKFYDTHKGKDGSLNVDIKPEQAKVLCAEFKSTSSKCRTHAVVGKLLGGVCASSNKHGSGKGSGYGSGSGGHEGFCSQAPSSLMKVCKEAQDKCKGSKVAAQQKLCMDAAIKRLQEMAKNLDFCGQAPSHMAQKCKDEQKKCMTSSSVKAEQQACWDAKMKELERQTNRGSGSGSSSKDGDSMDNAWANAFGDCPVLKKFIEANKGKDGSLNVKMNPEQAKPLCAEFKSTSSKCRTHAVVGKMLGGNCGGAGAKCVLRCFWQTSDVNIPSHPLVSPRPRDPPNVRNVYSKVLPLSNAHMHAQTHKRKWCQRFLR